jgi:DNA-binding transcriptional ArsR family regulator
MTAQEANATLDVRLHKALSHPLRQQLLAAMDGRVASPNQLATELGLPLPNVAYHVKILLQNGVVELVRTEPRRGATEHFYRAAATHVSVTSLALDDAAYEQLTRLLAATVDRALQLQEETAARIAADGSSSSSHTTELALIHLDR